MAKVRQVGEPGLAADARVGECARLDAGDFAVTARADEVRLHGKGDEVRSVPLSGPARKLVSAWLDVRGCHPGPAWTGQRGPLTDSGLTQVVLAAGNDAKIPGLRRHRCRRTFATRLQQGGADPAQVQAMLGHASIDTSARYFNSRELHQPGEKPQVSRSQQCRNSVPLMLAPAA